MSDDDLTDHLQVLRHYLQRGRDALLWKLEGLSEYDARRPLTPTGTNVLGVVKHVATVEAGYLGDCFGRPWPEPMPWTAPDAPDDADMWATAEESIDAVAARYRRVWAHSDITLDTFGPDTRGEVPWWPQERRRPTLLRVMVHLTTETHRHAGHADIVREQIDGSAGMHPAWGNLGTDDPDHWPRHVAALTRVAESFRDR